MTKRIFLKLSKKHLLEIPQYRHEMNQFDLWHEDDWGQLSPFTNTIKADVMKRALKFAHSRGFRVTQKQRMFIL